jgi:hypothetical protein
MIRKMLLVVLALTVMSWAQTATQTPSSPSQPGTTAEKAKCACCDKMASDKMAIAGMSSTDAKDTHSCCAHHDMHGMQANDGKDKASSAGNEGMSCGPKDDKDAKSCMKGEKDKMGTCCGDKCAKDKTAASCCGGSCGKDDKKGCCASEKKIDNS